MAPKREAEPLPDDGFGGDYSHEKRVQVSRNDGARKRDSRKYTLGQPIPPAKFDEMERQLEQTLMRSKFKEEEKAAAAKLAAVVNQGLLEQAIVISQLPPIIDLVTDSDEE